MHPPDLKKKGLLVPGRFQFFEIKWWDSIDESIQIPSSNKPKKETGKRCSQLRMVHTLYPTSFLLPLPCLKLATFSSKNIPKMSHLPFSLTPPISENLLINKIMAHSSATISPLEASFRQEKAPNCPLNSGKRAPTKKERHTQISTAQGLRDRRVRLSINIARDFFSFQDLLGFDKASKTLEWLLYMSHWWAH